MRFDKYTKGTEIVQTFLESSMKRLYWRLLSVGSHHNVVWLEMNLTDLSNLVASNHNIKHTVSYREIETIIKRQDKKPWTDQHKPSFNNLMAQLSRQEQGIKLRLLTRHCWSRAHLCPQGLPRLSFEHVKQASWLQGISCSSVPSVKNLEPLSAHRALQWKAKFGVKKNDLQMTKQFIHTIYRSLKLEPWKTEEEEDRDQATDRHYESRLH